MWWGPMPVKGTANYLSKPMGNEMGLTAAYGLLLQGVTPAPERDADTTGQEQPGGLHGHWLGAPG